MPQPAMGSPESNGRRPRKAASIAEEVQRYCGTAGHAEWTLFEGDCLKALALLPSDSVNCVVTSPPYYWQRDYEVEGQIGHESTIQEYVEALTECFGEIHRVLRGDGVFFLNLGDTYYSAKGRPHGKDPKQRGRDIARNTLRAVDGPGLGLPRKSLIGIPWRVALALQEDGWTLRSDVVWKRPAPLPEPSARDRPWRTYEHVFVFAKEARYWFDRVGLDGQEDLWLIAARPDNPGAHFAPFPTELAERCIKCGCPEGGVVLDPFVGSGTTIVAALGLGMDAIGIELNPAFCEFVLERIATTSKHQTALLADR